MQITDVIIEAFLHCPLKAHHLLSGRTPARCKLTELAAPLDSEHVERARRTLGLSVAEPIVHEDLRTQPHALEQAGLGGAAIPVRIFPGARLSESDRTVLGFDGLVLERARGDIPSRGIAIIGPGLRRSLVGLPALVDRARKTLEATRVLAASPPPQLTLNRHCARCDFQSECRQRAADADDLSLMTGLKASDLAVARRRGIFTVTQLSYTFRARRRRRIRHEWSLQALSIREKRTHVFGAVDLPSRSAGAIALFLDVEGDPDSDRYYLVGVRFASANGTTQFSFWADLAEQERVVWQQLLDLLEGLPDYTLFHYGSYETRFIRRMEKRYSSYKPDISARLRERATNVLALIHGWIHFPTLSNGLKDIAGLLGFHWSGPVGTGLECALWRRRWEHQADVGLRDEIIRYNSEDCAALETVVDAIYAIRDGRDGTAVDASTLLARGIRGKFKKNDFVLPELAVINSCAYFDYQNNRVLLRTNPVVRKALQRSERVASVRPRVNCIVELRSVSRCPECRVERPYLNARLRKRVVDLRFGPGYVKRWVTEYRSAQYRCRSCGETWLPRKYRAVRSKQGRDLGCWLVYQVIAHKQPAGAIVDTLREAFGIVISRQRVHLAKQEFASFYRRTYEGILRRLARAPMVQVDETKANVLGYPGYVWVFASGEDVAFAYAAGRDATVLQSVLATFRGVLVSDFYAAYESMPCPQQKCLIHLIRDLNDDLFANQLDPELRELVQGVSGVLRPIVSTIDEHGLRRRHLRKHQAMVDRFFGQLERREYRSEPAEKNRARLLRCQSKLFTFLDHDGVPWNNNGAEHAIKEFAALRRTIGGTSTEQGMKDYLTLLSIRQSLRMRGLGFLDFLRAGTPDLLRFAAVAP